VRAIALRQTARQGAHLRALVVAEPIAGAINSVDTATILSSNLFFMSSLLFVSEERKDTHSPVFADLSHRSWIQIIPATTDPKINRT
jgi:hypothetical protein